jgi:hypothetical protein
VLGCGAALIPLDHPGPYPDLMLVWRCSKSDPDGPFSPGNRVGLHQFLNAVFPQDPGMHRMRDSGRAGCELRTRAKLRQSFKTDDVAACTSLGPSCVTATGPSSPGRLVRICPWP